MPILNIDVSKFNDLVLPWFRECTPKLLVVTDNLNYSAADGFGLTEFVDALRNTTIHGMMPIVTTASFHPSAVLSYDATNNHITNYKFTDATHGVRKSRYDVVFLLSINGEFGPLLTDESGALDALTTFMQDGGGVFATGDHADLGAAMGKDVPRVRSMRKWLLADTPSAGGIDRLTTTAPGADQQYEFSDQSDQFPQRLYVNYRPDALGNGNPHPVLQVPGAMPARAIEVFPDHPHEGECVVPSNLTTKLADGVTDEWPVAPVGGGRVSPEMVAMTMSHGNAFPGKAAVVPRSFMAICAYDGQLANVGRVVTDATWHHFVNINIKPGFATLNANDLADIKQYYSNLAIWLMPKNLPHRSVMTGREHPTHERNPPSSVCRPISPARMRRSKGVVIVSPAMPANSERRMLGQPGPGRAGSSRVGSTHTRQERAPRTPMNTKRSKNLGRADSGSYGNACDEAVPS